MIKKINTDFHRRKKRQKLFSWIESKLFIRMLLFPVRRTPNIELRAIETVWFEYFGRRLKCGRAEIITQKVNFHFIFTYCTLFTSYSVDYIASIILYVGCGITNIFNMNIIFFNVAYIYAQKWIFHLEWFDSKTIFRKYHTVSEMLAWIV